MTNRKKITVLILILLICLDQFDCRKGGSSGRGSSGSRGKSGGIGSSGGRGSSGARSGGIFGGGRSSGGGGTHSSGIGHGSSHSKGTGSSGGLGKSGSRGSSGARTGGIFGGKPHPSGGGGSSHSTSIFSKGSGIGSKHRSDKFKNMIVGAAAGYLAYKGGKAIIKNIAAPMIFPKWGTRHYYWGSQYYPQHQQQSMQKMCRMPLDPNDPSFANIYTGDNNSRPKEIVWSCSYNEYCCGYECCTAGRNAAGSSARDGGWHNFVLLSTLAAIIMIF